MALRGIDRILLHAAARPVDANGASRAANRGDGRISSNILMQKKLGTHVMAAGRCRVTAVITTWIDPAACRYTIP